ncbi:uncharacterized protein BO95DRAFT_249075 [Aspergillus brunneoviolaceus CBS 621.78]|uniref:Uncharacterized protein n=1 Tax=Aspergillus brunneoviolaceus CBS 621.78 TaxID=1450534 RepID=A0ACD1GKP4_9EURO|nr:hypothetical protein BO95DRAFT_249075 [Aspergillus brunneoviolaceus CBS 621.78]RAH49904.1 hypothetical protein BO95DRAFT_249075 [Aspergillus brunneoviolaceus CBS 621.78]
MPVPLQGVSDSMLLTILSLSLALEPHPTSRQPNLAGSCIQLHFRFYRHTNFVTIVFISFCVTSSSSSPRVSCIAHLGVKCNLLGWRFSQWHFSLESDGTFHDFTKGQSGAIPLIEHRRYSPIAFKAISWDFSQVRSA